MTTAIVCVWAQLYFEGKGDPDGNPMQLEGILRNVYALTKAVKEERSMALSHCDAALLIVYPPGTIVPIQKGTRDVKSWEAVPNDATGESPIIVVAPEKVSVSLHGVCVVWSNSHIFLLKMNLNEDSNV
jgi:hypothetical protein